MVTLQASESGIIQIKNAVERIKVKRGWSKQSFHWIDEALRIYEERYPQSDSIESGVKGISGSTWNRFRGCKPVNNIAFEIFCQILELDWKEIAKQEENEPSLNSFSYISACGLHNPPEKRNVFNDYSGRRAIDELWADPIAEKSGEKVAIFT